MKQGRQEVKEYFEVIELYSVSLRESVGEQTAAARLHVVKELIARLSHKYLLAATKREIQAAGKLMIGEGRGREEMKALQKTLVELFDRACHAGVLATHPLRSPADGTEPVITPPEMALAVGLGSTLSEKVQGQLGSVGMTAFEESSHQAAADRVGWFPFAFVISSLPPVAPITFLDAVRASGSLCRNAGLVLVTRDEQADYAASFVGRGANRVIAHSEIDERLAGVMAELGVVSERVRFRVPVEAVFGDGEFAEQWQTENISATGILVRTSTDLVVGSEAELKLTVPGDDLPIQAQAEVVRSTTFGREDFSGLGLRFLSFVGESQHRLDLFLHRSR